MIAWLHNTEALYRLPRWNRPYRTAGSLTLDPVTRCWTWTPYLSVRAEALEVAQSEIQRVRLDDGFFVVHVFLVTDHGNVHLTVFPRRIAAALRSVGFQLHTNPAWPGVTIAAPSGREVSWSHEL